MHDLGWTFWSICPLCTSPDSSYHKTLNSLSYNQHQKCISVKAVKFYSDSQLFFELPMHENYPSPDKGWSQYDSRQYRLLILSIFFHLLDSLTRSLISSSCVCDLETTSTPWILVSNLKGFIKIRLLMKRSSFAWGWFCNIASENEMKKKKKKKKRSGIKESFFRIKIKER